MKRRGIKMQMIKNAVTLARVHTHTHTHTHTGNLKTKKDIKKPK